jgi:hypothetical protein
LDFFSESTREAMFFSAEPDAYYALCNPALLRAIPATVRRILDVGCGEGGLGRALKQLEFQDPQCAAAGVTPAVRSIGA